MVWNAVTRIHTDGIAGMYAGSLHQFHDAGHKYILTVADSVDLHFFSSDIMIH